MLKQIITVVILTAVALWAATPSPRAIIFSGTDTVSFRDQSAVGTSFDLLAQRSNISYDDLVSDTFFAHITLTLEEGKLCGIAPSKLSNKSLWKNHGKMNLDSIKMINEDDMVNKLGNRYGCFFEVPFEDLNSLIGTCFTLKTALDPRINKTPLYVKLKILDFIVNDAATHDVDMKFLWLTNRGQYDLTSPTPIDTISGGSVAITEGVTNSVVKINQRGTSFRLTGTSFIVPEEFRKYNSLQVYNFRGQLLETVKLQGQRVVQLSNDNVAKIVRFER